MHGIVRSFDGDSESLLLRHPRIALHGCDLADADGLGRVIDELEPDEVYNLAGISSVALSWQIPMETGLINGIAVAAILEAGCASSPSGPESRCVCSKHRARRSSGSPRRRPRRRRRGSSPRRRTGPPRRMPQLGPCLPLRADSARRRASSTTTNSPRRPETFVTRKITAAAARISLGMQEVLELGDMEVLRDWGWAPDYVDAMVRAARHPTPDDYLIATGEQHSVEEFVAAAVRGCRHPRVADAESGPTRSSSAPWRSTACWGTPPRPARCWGGGPPWTSSTWCPEWSKRIWSLCEPDRVDQVVIG